MKNAKEPPDVAGSQEKSQTAGFVVKETVVWKRGQSRSFSPEEIARGDAEKWLEGIK